MGTCSNTCLLNKACCLRTDGRFKYRFKLKREGNLDQEVIGAFSKEGSKEWRL